MSADFVCFAGCVKICLRVLHPCCVPGGFGPIRNLQQYLHCVDPKRDVALMNKVRVFLGVGVGVGACVGGGEMLSDLHAT